MRVFYAAACRSVRGRFGRSVGFARGQRLGLVRRSFLAVLTVVFAVVSTMCPINAHAANVRGTITGYARTTATGGTYARQSGVIFENGKAATLASIDLFGKTVTIPASLQTAATAGLTIAMGATRLTPLGIASSVAAWLLLSGIQQDPENPGNYMKTGNREEMGNCYFTQTVTTCSSSQSDAANALVAFYNGLEGKSPGFISAVAGMRDMEFRIISRYISAQHVITRDNWVPIYVRQDLINVPFTRALTPQDVEDHVKNNPVVPDEVLNDSPVPVPVGPAKSEPKWVPSAPPYECPSMPSGLCEDGALVQTDDTTEDPTDYKITPGTRDATKDVVATDQVSQPPSTDLCKLHPEALMCQQLGEAPKDEVPKSTASVTFSAEVINLPSACPADIPIKGGVLSFATACEISQKMRPLVVAIAGFVALMIAAAAIRGAS